jgi:hypothetical protein
MDRVSPAADGRTTEVRYPSTSDVYATVAAASPAMVASEVMRQLTLSLSCGG